MLEHEADSVRDPTCAAPPDFEEMRPYGEFGALIGPLYRRRDEATRFGMRVSEKHCSAMKIVHGGMIASFIDTAFAQASRKQVPNAEALVTTHVSIDYMGAARLHDWLEAKVTVLRAGARILFLDCHLSCGDRLVAHGTGQFLVTHRT